MRVKVYYQGEADVLTVPAGLDILDYIYEVYGAYLEYDIL